MKQLIEDLLSALEYHAEQTRPIHSTTVAIQAAKEALKTLDEKNAKPAEQQEPVAMRQEFERWAAEYSTLSLALDAHGHYASIEQEMLWHAWQAAKKNAPEGAFGGESAANDRPGLAVADSTCNHEFVLDFKSSIRLCKHCGRMERKATPPANAKQEQRIAELEKDAARWQAIAMLYPGGADALFNQMQKIAQELATKEKQ